MIKSFLKTNNLVINNGTFLVDSLSFLFVIILIPLVKEFKNTDDGYKTTINCKISGCIRATINAMCEIDV